MCVGSDAFAKTSQHSLCKRLIFLATQYNDLRRKCIHGEGSLLRALGGVGGGVCVGVSTRLRHSQVYDSFDLMMFT